MAGIDAFLSWLELYKSLKQSTLHRHKHKSAKIYPVLHKQGISLEVCVGWLAAEKRRGLKDCSLKSVAKTLRLIVEYESSLGNCEDFRNKLPSFREQVPSIDVLSVDEIQKILNVKGKYQLILELLARTGRRIGEVVALKKEQFDSSRCAILLDDPKNRQSRWMPIPDDLAVKILETTKHLRPEQYIFPTSYRHGVHVTPQSVNLELKQRAQKAGIHKRVYAHLLRHSFPVELLRNNVPLPMVSELLTHQDYRITQRYVHLVLDDLQLALTSHPLNKNTPISSELTKKRIKKYLTSFTDSLGETVAVKITEESQRFTLVVEW